MQQGVGQGRQCVQQYSQGQRVCIWPGRWAAARPWRMRCLTPWYCWQEGFTVG